jgi:hypothetical protein
MRLRRALGAVGVLLALVTGCDTPPAASPPTTADLRCPPATTTTIAPTTTAVTTTVAPTTTAKPTSGAAPLTRQMLLDAGLPGVAPVGTSDPNLVNPRYSSTNAGQTYRLVPGTVETRDASGTLAAGYGPWVEISSLSWTNPGNVKLDIIGHLYSVDHAGHFTERYRFGAGAGGWAKHLWTWQTELGLVGEGEGAAGWGSADNQGHHFGDQLADNQAPGGQGFVRVHGWGMWWTSSASQPWSTFWTSVDPTSDHAAASAAKLADLGGLVQTLEVRLVGTPAAVAASRYAVSSGWDTYWQGANTTTPVNRTGSGSGFRAIAPTSTPTLIVTSTLSPMQVAAWPLTAYPGWVG